MTYEEILEKFNIVSRYKDKAQCRCPAHDDKKASLTISAGDRGVLLHCHAGCALDSILEAVGLQKSDLFYDQKPQNSKWRNYVESREGRQIEAIYNYTLFNGAYAFTKIRLQGKKLLYGTLKNNQFTYGLKGLHRKDLKAVYPGVQRLNKAISEGRLVFYVEGEKDVDTLKKHGYATITAGGVNDWQADMSALFKGANVAILSDNDAPGKRLAETIKNDLRGIAKSTKIIVPCPDIEHADITDYFNVGHTREDFERLIAEKPVTKPRSTGFKVEEVKKMLLHKVECDRDGKERSRKIIQSVRNHEIVLENDCRFKGKIKYDEFARQVYLMGDVPWETENNFRSWGSCDDSALFSILQADYGLTSRNDFYDGIKNISMKHKFHPVRNLLDSLQWDGAEHIRPLLPECLGAEDTEYNFQTMRLWMLGAVARIYQPGIKFDYCLILQGEQGIGKSTFLQLMAMNDLWFSDSLDSLDGDKAAQSLVGTWIIELAELKSLARTAGGIESVKRFLTATQDKYRIPYERRAEVFLRQNVFAGTTNKTDFLTDGTGNRRFLIIQTGVNEPKKNLFNPGIMDDIKGAWAQAVHTWKSERPKLILPDSYAEEARKVQEEFLSDDGKTGLISEYLADKNRACVLEIWREALKETGRPAKWLSSEISSIVLSLPGWKRMKSPAKFGEYGSQRGFQKNYIVGDCSQGFLEISDDELKELPFN